MSAATYQDVLERARQLSNEERRRLVSALAAQERPDEGPRPRWEDYIGTLPYPACGEDAQAWVSRTRAESDQGRVPE